MTNIEEKAHADNATQNINPPIIAKDTHTHTIAHTASLIHLLVKKNSFSMDNRVILVNHILRYNCFHWETIVTSNLNAQNHHWEQL